MGLFSNAGGLGSINFEELERAQKKFAKKGPSAYRSEMERVKSVHKEHSKSIREENKLGKFLVGKPGKKGWSEKARKAAIIAKQRKTGRIY